MKKVLMFAFVGAVVLTVAGCHWCSEPQAGDPSCIAASHHYDRLNKPDTTSMVTPQAPSGTVRYPRSPSR